MGEDQECESQKNADQFVFSPVSECLIGDPRATRTPNLLIRSQMLYPIELWDHLVTDAPSKAQMSNHDYYYNIVTFLLIQLILI